jgi:hypothetical protein
MRNIVSTRTRSWLFTPATRPRSLRVSLVSHPKEIADLILMAAGRKKIAVRGSGSCKA